MIITAPCIHQHKNPLQCKRCKKMRQERIHALREYFKNYDPNKGINTHGLGWKEKLLK